MYALKYQFLVPFYVYEFYFNDIYVLYVFQ